MKLFYKMDACDKLKQNRDIENHIQSHNPGKKERKILSNLQSESKELVSLLLS